MCASCGTYLVNPGDPIGYMGISWDFVRLISIGFTLGVVNSALVAILSFISPEVLFLLLMDGLYSFYNLGRRIISGWRRVFGWDRVGKVFTVDGWMYRFLCLIVLFSIYFVFICPISPFILIVNQASFWSDVISISDLACISVLIGVHKFFRVSLLGRVADMGLIFLSIW